MARSKILSRLILLFALCLLLSLLAPHFLRAENLLNIVRQAAILNILGIGMTVVILTGGIDLSNGAVLALSSCVSAIYLKEGGSILVGILISLGIGLACGFINGWMVARVLIPPFVITYAMMFFARGLAYIVLKGKIIYGFSKMFRFLGAGHLFSIPTPIVLSALILLIFYFLLRYTPFGADLYAVGSDEESSRLSGHQDPESNPLGLCPQRPSRRRCRNHLYLPAQRRGAGDRRVLCPRCHCRRRSGRDACWREAKEAWWGR